MAFADLSSDIQAQLRAEASNRQNWTPAQWALLFSRNDVTRWRAIVMDCPVRGWEAVAQARLAEAEKCVKHFEDEVLEEMNAKLHALAHVEMRQAA